MGLPIWNSSVLVLPQAPNWVPRTSLSRGHSGLWEAALLAAVRTVLQGVSSEDDPHPPEGCFLFFPLVSSHAGPAQLLLEQPCRASSSLCAALALSVLCRGFCPPSFSGFSVPVREGCQNSPVFLLLCSSLETFFRQ